MSGLFPNGFCSNEGCENYLSSDEEIEAQVCEDCRSEEEPEPWYDNEGYHGHERVV